MITFKDFIAAAFEIMLEDKRGLTSSEMETIARLKKTQGSAAAKTFRAFILSRGVRHLPPDEQAKAWKQRTAPKNLPPGYVGKWNPETREYENINKQ